MAATAIDPQEQEQLPPEQGEEGEQEQAVDPDDVLKGREDLQIALKNLITKVAGQEKWPRRMEVVEARRQRFYDRGDQYIWWNAAKFVFATATSGLSFGGTSDSVDMPRYTDVYNIYSPYLDIITALLSQNPPGVDFEPDDPTSATDIAAANTAEKFRHQVDRVNDRKKLQTTIARYFATDGRCVLWTRFVEDAQRFGINDDGSPKSGELFQPYGVLEHKCPITARWQAEMGYQIISFEISLSLAKEENPDYADNIKPGSNALGESAYERLARLGALQGTRNMVQAGEAWSHLVTEQHSWLRPCEFQQEASAAKESGKDLMAELKQMFPSGCHAKFVGEAYCGSKDESMDDCLAIGHPRPGDGQNRPSWLKLLVAVQDAFNDYKNLEKEIYDYCQPTTWLASESFDIDAFREMTSEPGNYQPLVLPSGVTDIRAAVYAELAANAPPELIAAYNNLQGALAEFMTGAYPALFGGDTKQNDTAKGIGIQRDQAMARLGLPWGALQELMAKCYKQAIIQAIANRPEDEVLNVKVPAKRGRSTIAKIAIADLKGNFHCYPDQDSSFPETTGSKRQTFMSLMENEAMAPILQLPENQEIGKQWMGLEDLVVPFAAAFDQAAIIIEKLLKEQPLPPSPQDIQNAEAEYMQGLAKAKMGPQVPGEAPVPIPPPPPLLQWVSAEKQAVTAGQPPPPPPPESLHPSVPIDAECDFSAPIWTVVQDWLAGDERREQDKAGNQAGVMNVRLYGLAQKANAALQSQGGTQQKVSESIAFKDLPPDGQVQLAAQAGIKIQPPPPPAPPQSEKKPPAQGAA